MNQNQKQYISNPFKVIFNGFGALFKYNQNLSIILLIFTLFTGFSSYSTDLVQGPALTKQITTGSAPPFFLIIAIILSIITLTIFCAVMFSGIAAYTALMTSRQQTVTFSQAFKITLSKFWVLLGISIIVSFKIVGGLILFLIPGLRAIARYQLVYMFVFDQNLGIGQSLSQSKQLSKDHLLELFGILSASMIIPIVGSLMQIGGQSVAYAQLTKLKSTPHHKPDIHWLNYLAIFGPLILISLFIFLITIIVMIVA